MKSGLSQSDFAKLLGVSVRTLQDWEQGRRELSGAANTYCHRRASPGSAEGSYPLVDAAMIDLFPEFPFDMGAPNSSSLRKGSVWRF